MSKSKINENVYNCMEKIFEEYDKDNSGFLEYDESEKFFIDFCKLMGVQNVNPKLIPKLFNKCDIDGDGRLSKKEIYQMILECL